MKGVVFTEFMEMVDSHFSPELTETLIDRCDLPSGGAYTAIGTYDAKEMTNLVAALAQETGTPAPALVRAFGEHLFGRFASAYPSFFVGVTSAFDFLEGIDAKIHVEVKKLYPDAELPRFAVTRTGDERLELVYKSPRCLGDLAAGLIQGCLAHFSEPMIVQEEELSDGHRSEVRFSLRRSGAG